jgi:hypothetical protein
MDDLPGRTSQGPGVKPASGRTEERSRCVGRALRWGRRPAMVWRGAHPRAFFALAVPWTFAASQGLLLPYYNTYPATKPRAAEPGRSPAARVDRLSYLLAGRPFGPRLVVL